MKFGLLSRTLRSATEADRARLVRGLDKVRADDSTIRVEADEDTGSVVVSGVGELQLEIVIERLQREFGAAIEAGPPQVVHKIHVTRAADGEMKWARQTGGRGQYGHVKIHLRPGEFGSGVIFRNGIVDGAIPDEFIAPVEQGIRLELTRSVVEGVLARVDDVDVEVYGGSYHDLDSSAMAFRLAGAHAFHDALKKAQPVLLEPVMQVELTVPSEFLDEVLGSLRKRRGQILSDDAHDTARIVTARVPLSAMLGYSSDLRKRTRGQGTFSMRFDYYQPVQHTEGDVDRDSFVGAPLRPRSPLRSSSMSVPEPEDDMQDPDTP